MSGFHDRDSQSENRDSWFNRGLEHWDLKPISGGQFPDSHNHQKVVVMNAEGLKGGRRPLIFIRSIGDLFQDEGTPILNEEGVLTSCISGCITSSHLILKPPFQPGDCLACSRPTRPLTAADVRKYVFAVCRKLTNSDFVIPTRYPQRIRQFLPDSWGPDGRSNVRFSVTTEDGTSNLLRLRDLDRWSDSHSS